MKRKRHETIDPEDRYAEGYIGVALNSAHDRYEVGTRIDGLVLWPEEVAVAVPVFNQAFPASSHYAWCIMMWNGSLYIWAYVPAEAVVGAYELGCHFRETLRRANIMQRPMICELG